MGFDGAQGALVAEAKTKRETKDAEAHDTGPRFGSPGVARSPRPPTTARTGHERRIPGTPGGLG
jgi:hypothetical protein